MINKIIVSVLPHMPERFVWIFSKRYIAGKSIDDAIVTAHSLNEDGSEVTFDILGEFITNLDEAQQNRDDYLRLIDTVEKTEIKGSYSVKPTMFGLLIDEDICYSHIRAIVQKASSYNNFIRIDMEDSECTTKTINLYRKLKSEFPNGCGIVLQAYLKRTLRDIKNLMDIHTKEYPLNIRLCKGIYTESPEIAYKKHDEINFHYLEDLEFMFQNKIFSGIATHDKYLINKTYKLIDKYSVTKDNYEFQMLYGVRPDLRKRVIARGHKLRVYVPFGEHWFGYSTRRLKENPKIAQHIIKALFVRG